MLANYLKIAWRNLLKHKAYSILNLSGLVAGLTTSFILFLWAYDEFRVDQFHTNIDRLYQVMINDYYPDGKIETYGSPTVKMGDVLSKEVPGIDQVVQCSWDESMLLKTMDKSFVEKGIYADSTLFDLFSFPFLVRDNQKALPGSGSIAISEKLAKKFFNEENPIGKIIVVKKAYPLMVSSVFKDIPSYSTIQFDFVISFELWKNENTWADHWRSGATRAFLSLVPTASFTNVDNQVRQIIKNKCSDCQREAFLAAFSDSYLYNTYVNGKIAGGRINQLILFVFIAFVVLLIANINFVNLTTARAMTRFKEIGVRKVTGAGKRSIQFQFLCESIITSVIAMLFSLLMVCVLMPYINSITGKEISFTLQKPTILFGVIAITGLSGVLGGLYPAFYLSGLKTILILKYKGGFSVNSPIHLRKALVVFQFASSIILLIGSIFIYKQLSYISSKELGYQRENIIVLNHKEEYNANYAAFKNDLLQIATIKNVAFVGSNIFQIPITSTDPVWPGKPIHSSINFKILRCDEGFIPAIHIHLQSGRNFIETDSANYIINEQAMLSMGLTKDNVIGTKLEMWNGKGEIIGLTNDFATGNLYQATQPLILMYSKSNGNYHFIETIDQSDSKQTLTKIESVLKKYAPDYPFEYQFLDVSYNQEYIHEAAQAKLVLGFTIITLIICCLGLFGLSAYTVERKVKEIGVRKLFGASIPSIINSISKEFIVMVLISIVIAIPIAYILVAKWMNRFAFHTDLNWEVFAVAATISIMIAVLTTSIQAVKAAIATPIKSLRSE